MIHKMLVLQGLNEQIDGRLPLGYGGRFGWEEPGRATMCCSDSKNPVVFKIKRLDMDDGERRG